MMCQTPGTMKSSEIAAAVGYCDEYHFSKAFKKAAGVSPRKYLEGNHVLTSEKKEGIFPSLTVEK